MVRFTCGRRDLGRTKNGGKRCKISIRVDFMVIPSRIIDINAHMLIFIHKLTETTKIPNITERVNSGNSGFFGPNRPEPSKSYGEKA